MSDKQPKPKILIYSTAYYPFVGGAEVAVKEITDRLQGSFDFDLITTRFKSDLPKKEKIGCVTVYRIGFGSSLLDKLLLPFRGAILSRRLHKKAKYSCLWGVMVTFGSGAGYLFNILQFFTGGSRVPMVLTLQEGDSENHLQYKWGGLINLSWRLALWNTDFLTGISNFLLHRAEKHGYSGESALVPNGVDLDVFSKRIDEKEQEEVKRRLGKNPGDIFLVTSSRLTHKNAVDDVISAMAYMPQNVSFIIMGKGDDGPKLQKQARDLGVADRVKFLGFLPYKDIPIYFSACDIFIRASRSEGFGNSFIEAMASGIPVIATPVGGIVDFIDDRETGVFCSPDSPQSIVKAVEFYMKHESDKNRIVLEAKKRVNERYGWEKIAGQMGTVFEKTVKSP